MKNRAIVIVYILCVWFAISFVTNIIGPMLPTVISAKDRALPRLADAQL